MREYPLHRQRERPLSRYSIDIMRLEPFLDINLLRLTESSLPTSTNSIH